MKVCPKCGHATADDSDEFCVKCGAYYTEAKKAQGQQASPMAVALGMTTAPTKPQVVPVPEGGTLKAGFDHMEAGNYPEAIAQWISAVCENGQPSEEDYRRMVDAAIACIMGTVGDGAVHSRAGTAELAMELDEDLIQDMMAGLCAKACEQTSGNAIADLVVEYMYFAMESYSVYPDLRDVSAVFSSVQTDLPAIRSAYDASEKDDAGRGQREIDISSSFAKLIGDEMEKGIREAGDERMDKLADYWSTKATLPYANIAYQVANLNAQISMAVNVGKFASKLFQKGLSMQLEGFTRSYFGPRV